MKRFLLAALAAVILFSQAPAAHAVSTSAASAILMDGDSGRVLYQSNAHDPRLIASVTKLMTALVALESGHNLDEVVTIDPAWAGVEGSSIYLQPGEEITLQALLYGMLLRSGNDAAVSVAGYCADSVEDFVSKMNEKARSLGMKNTHFSNPNGLNADDHYSSAYDMALLAKACLENEALSKMVATKTITMGTRIFTNHNKLLWRYQGCIGMKTGFTEKAGRTLVSAARRDGLSLICVTLNDPNDWADHTALFDYGFDNFCAQPLTQAGEVVCRLPVAESLMPFCPVVAGESVNLCLAPGEAVTRKLTLDYERLAAPMAVGTQVGEAVYYLNGTPVAQVPLVTGERICLDLAQSQGNLDKLLEQLEGLFSFHK